MLLRSCPRMKESGSKAIAEKREGKNQRTIFSFREAEGIGVTGGRGKEEAREGRKEGGNCSGKKFDWLCSVLFFAILKSGNALLQHRFTAKGSNCFSRMYVCLDRQRTYTKTLLKEETVVIGSHKYRTKIAYFP